MDILEITPVHRQIYDYLTQRGIKITWLANGLNMSQPNMSLALHGKKPLTADHITKINQILGTDFKITQPSS